MGLRAPLQARPIDMGLPSGVQWASCNVGAARPSDLGLYFSWGNIVGHGIDEGYDFSQVVYNSTPAANIMTDISLDQDAARANLGEPWRMPTIDEFQELYDNCTTVWYTMNGINGILFTSNLNGKKIFFPAAGYYNNESLNKHGLDGYYWSSSFESAVLAHRLHFTELNVDVLDYNYRYRGFSVRAVLEPT